MDAFVFKFDAKKLRAIDRRYLGFLIASGHCCNELAILLPYIIFEHNLKRANAFEAAFILTRRYTIDRILISKIVEYGELYSKLLKDSKGASDPLLLELSKNYDPIAVKIKSAKWARILRNKISFHYDPQYALDALDRLDDDHPMRFMAGRIKGLTLFEFAEEIASRPIFEAAGKGDIGSGMDAANAFILDLVSSITAFHAQATISMFRAYGIAWERSQMKLRKKYFAAPGNVLIPISVSPATVLRVRSKKSGKRKLR
jgi:hypothetical protein